VIQEQLCIITAQPEFLEAALDELKRLDTDFNSKEILAPGMALCAVSQFPKFLRIVTERRPIFVRHITPVQTVVPISNSEQDIGELAVAIASLPAFAQLERGQHFAVQTRLIQSNEQSVKRVYSSGLLNKALAEAIVEETGAIESIKKPQIVISLLCTAETAYIGISPVSENLSDWPGGARQFAQIPEQISRAEFKLLEALEVFGVSLPTHGRALDLGAAPGGWTRLLLEAGLSVIAVDPANLDPRLKANRESEFSRGAGLPRPHSSGNAAYSHTYRGRGKPAPLLSSTRNDGEPGNPRLEHVRGYAEDYLEQALKTHQRFEIITNDMRMDARDAVRLLNRASMCLHPEGFLISTLKLPHATSTMNPLAILHESISMLNRQYGIVQARQLFHNRQEVTVIAANPFSQRR
jgi:23S rRNA (cytidine2498-2'-O)-methyltransferase